MRNKMDARNVVVVGTWAFVIIWLVGMLALRGDLLITFVLFFVAVAISFAATALPKEGLPESGQSGQEWSQLIILAKFHRLVFPR
jgi:hypothetical protein